MMLNENEKKILLDLASSDDANFVELAKIAGLDPRSAFRGADLRGVDFSECDLNGFDFTDADLRGATFDGASLRGATFNGVLRPSKRRDTEQVQRYDPPKETIKMELTAYQQRILELMREALDERGRALALMPVGTGRSAVLIELIALTVPDSARAALIVTSAAEREQMISLLRRHVPGRRVMTARDATETPRWEGIVVHNATLYDNNFEAVFGATYSNLDFLFSTSLELLHRLKRVGESRLGYVRTAVFDTPLFDTPPFDVRYKELNRQDRLVRELFDQPTFVLSIEQALELRQLIQARIVRSNATTVIPPTRTVFSSSVSHQSELIEQLGPVTADLAAVIQAMRPESLLVLCRDVAQSKVVSNMLRKRLHDDDRIRLPTSRWSAEQIRSDLEVNGGIVVAALGRRSIDAARLLDNVVVLTPMRLALAQELAFRPPGRFRKGMEPQIIDYAGAFDRFPSVENAMKVGERYGTAL